VGVRRSPAGTKKAKERTKFQKGGKDRGGCEYFCLESHSGGYRTQKYNTSGLVTPKSNLIKTAGTHY